MAQKAQIRIPLPADSSPTTILRPPGAGESISLYCQRGKEGMASKDRSDPPAVQPIRPIPASSLGPPNPSSAGHYIAPLRCILEFARPAATEWLRVPAI